MIEEKMITLLRQGKISKWFSGIGQEAISTGITSVLNKDEFILPMHRNLSVFTSRNIPLKKTICSMAGKQKMVLLKLEIEVFTLVLLNIILLG